MRTGQPPCGGSPATAMSPPRLTRTPPPPAGTPRRGGRAVRTKALGGRPEIETDPGGHAQPRAVQPDRPPAGHRRWRPPVADPGIGADRRQVTVIRADRREVTVVAQPDDRRADRRVGQAAGPPRGRQRHPDRLCEAGADQVAPAVGAVNAGDLRVVAEPAGLRGRAGPVPRRPRPAPPPDGARARRPRARSCRAHRARRRPRCRFRCPRGPRGADGNGGHARLAEGKPAIDPGGAGVRISYPRSSPGGSHRRRPGPSRPYPSRTPLPAPGW